MKNSKIKSYMNDPKQISITKLGSWATYFFHVKGTKTTKKIFSNVFGIIYNTLQTIILSYSNFGKKVV